jgi:integrase/recombinase XerD
MATEQGTLFDQRKYRGVIPQSYQIVAPTADQTITASIPAYHAYLSSGRFSKYTPDDFSSDIKRFGLYIGPKALKDVRSVDIQRWIGELKKTMAAKTVSRKIASIGNYFHWLEAEKVLKENPAKIIRAPRVTSPLPDILFDSECEQLLHSASNNPRTYLLVLLLLKSTELMGLKLTHFDFSNKYQPELWVKHTGSQVRKDRKLKLPSAIVSVIEDYVRQYGIDDTLFPYTQRFMRQLLTEATRAAGLRKKVTAGILRDTFVVRSLRQGMPIADVLKKIGLSDRTWDDAKNKYELLASKGL